MFVSRKEKPMYNKQIILFEFTRGLFKHLPCILKKPSVICRISPLWGRTIKLIVLA